MPFGVRVRSTERPEEAVVEEGVLDVAPVTAVSAELVPRTSRGRRQAAHSLAIDNRGNRAVNATITAADPDQLLAFAIDQTMLVSEPNSASFVKVRVRPKKSFRTGPPQTRPFQVIVQEAGENIAVAEGTMVQEALEPPWLRRAAALSLIGLLLLVALWFGLLRPTVRATAREAAREEVTPPTIGPGGDKGDKKGDGGGKKDDSVKSPEETPPPVAASSPIGGRLFLTSKGTTSYEVPEGFTLQLTDIVLQNPAGDTGPLEIRRAGTALLVVELGNFRDLDYHFVAPLLFTAGQKVELSANCISPTCTPGAYFAGFLVKA